MYRNILIATAASTTMGRPPTPSEAAPAYDDILQEHPLNAHAMSASSSTYRAVPGEEPDIELAHNHSTPVDSFTPHQHCENCDALTTAREIRANERHCCLWVSIVMMTISISLLLLAIVAIGAKFKYHKD